MTPTPRHPRADTAVHPNAPARSAQRAASVLLLAALVTAVFESYLLNESGAWQLLVAVVTLLVLASVTLVSLWLARRGRVTLSVAHLIGGMLTACVVIAAVLAGLGVVLGLGALLATIAIATQTLSQRRINLAVLAAVAAGVVMGLLDLFSPFDQLAVPELTTVAPAIIIGALVLYGILVVRQFQSYSMPSKLIVAFLTVSLASIAAVAFLVDRTIRASLADEVGAKLHSLVGARAQALGDLLAEQIHQLHAWSLNDVVQAQVGLANREYAGQSEADIRAQIATLDERWRKAGGDDARIVSLLNNSVALALREYANAFPDSMELSVSDRFGALVGATSRASEYDQADEAWWQAALNGGRGAFYISQPEYDESSGATTIAIAMPLRDHGTQAVIGILRTTYDLTALTRLLAATPAGKTGDFFLLVSGNRTIHVGHEGEAEFEVAGPDELAMLETALGGYAQFVLEDTASVVSAAPVVASSGETVITNLDWKVILHQDQEESFALLDQQSRGVLLAALVIVGVMSSAAVGLGHLLATPIARLTAVARQVAAGQLDVQVPSTTDDEVGTLAQTFNAMIARLRDLVSTLEARVEARTEQLRTSVEVGRATTSILDTDQLLREAVNLITDRFGFYYAAVFTLDESGRYAVLREATGEAGRVLKEHGHRLEVGGQSMVGYATSRRRPRIALDVGKEAVRFANPLLPDTRSEIALPLLVGDRVLGALDAQSTREAAFDDASAAVLQSMADQIAIALTNAEQFRRAESQAQAQARLLVATSDLVRQQDRQTLVNEMARNVVSLLAADGAEVWLPVGDDELERVAVSGALSSEHVGRRLGRGQGVAGRALVTGQTLRVDDVRAWAEHTPLHSEALFHAALAVPMLSPTQAAGVLVATRSQAGRPFTPDDERLTQLFATQAAVALSNLDLLEQQQRTLAELDAINRRLTSESYAAYYTRLPETARSTQFTRNNTSPIEPSAWLPEVELAVISKKPVAWSGREEQTVTSPFQAAMAAPIVLRGEVIGALQVGEANRSRPWAVEDLELIQSVADQVALAVENTRLFEEAQRTAYRERVVAEAADKIHRPVDLQAVLHAAIEEVQRVTGATQVGIRLGVADTDRDGNGNGRAPGSTGG